MAYKCWSPRIFLKQIIDGRAVGASALVKNPKACLIHFHLPLSIVDSEVILVLVINCQSQRANVFLLNKAARTGTATDKDCQGVTLGSFQDYSYPYPRKPLPLTRGRGFEG